MTAAHLFLFHIGLTIFEWGSVRKKSANMVVLRHFLTFCTSTLCIFVIGFDFAYGNSISGTRYLFSMNFLAVESG